MCRESGTKAAVPFVLVVAFYVVVILYIQQRGDFISAWLIFCSVSSLSHRFRWMSMLFGSWTAIHFSVSLLLGQWCYLSLVK
jgi:hypothetical protein